MIEIRCFEGLPQRKPEIMSSHSFWLSLTMRESLETSDLYHRTLTTVPVLSFPELCPLVSFKSCVLSRIRVLVILIACTLVRRLESLLMAWQPFVIRLPQRQSFSEPPMWSSSLSALLETLKLCIDG